jgi:hypothetical protein
MKKGTSKMLLNIFILAIIIALVWFIFENKFWFQLFLGLDDGEVLEEEEEEIVDMEEM